MKALVWITLGALAAIAPAAHGAPYGRAGVFVLDANAAADAESGPKVTSYAESESPAAGRTLAVRADSNAAAVFLVAAFDRRDSRFPQNLAPLLVERRERFTEVAYPDLEDPTTDEWKFGEPHGHAELFVLVFRPDDPLLAEPRKLLAVLATSDDPKLRDSLARELRKMIGRWSSRQAKSESKLRYKAATIAATLRGGTYPLPTPDPVKTDPAPLAKPGRENLRFPWQEELSYKRDLPGDGPAILAFHIGPPEESEKSSGGAPD